MPCGTKTDLVELCCADKTVVMLWDPSNSKSKHMMDLVDFYAGKGDLHGAKVVTICCGDWSKGSDKMWTGDGEDRVLRWANVEQVHADEGAQEMLEGHVDADRYPWFVAVARDETLAHSGPSLSLSLLY